MRRYIIRHTTTHATYYNAFVVSNHYDGSLGAYQKLASELEQLGVDPLDVQCGRITESRSDNRIVAVSAGVDADCCSHPDWEVIDGCLPLGIFK